MSANMEHYQGALRDLAMRCTSGNREDSLHAAYELGRAALTDGLSLLDMAAALHRALIEACSRATTVAQVASTVEGFDDILLEALSPFEMAVRGAREANGALRRQNEILEEETRRIAHELHDSAGQLLVSAHLTLDRLADDMAPSAHRHLSEVRAVLDKAEERIRHLSHELRPTVLDDLGLLPAIRFLGNGISTRTRMAVTVGPESMERLPAVVEVALYRIVQEALTNAVKHSRASRVDVDFHLKDGRIGCDIRDDGVGLAGQGERPGLGTGGLGLLGIRERVTSLGGTLRIDSGVERGTILHVAIPLEGVDVASHSAG